VKWAKSRSIFLPQPAISSKTAPFLLNLQFLMTF
jgi:hypothetical protein